MNKDTRITTEYFLYGLIFLLAVILRFSLLGRNPLGEYEASWAYQAWQIWKGESIQFGSLVSYLSITEAFYFIFGSGEFTARIWPALAGSLVVWVPFFIRNRYGRVPALVLAVGLAIDPALVSVSRFAGSPIPALVFTLLAGVMFHHQRLKWSLILLSLGFLSGPNFWLGITMLGITLVLSGILRCLEPKKYFQARFSASKNQKKSPMPGARGYILPALVVLGIGSFFFSQPQGLSAWISGLPEFLWGWINPSGVSVLNILVSPVLSNPLIIVFGGLGYLFAWKENDQIGKLSSLWFGISLFLILLYPGRQAADLIWVVVPLWVSAARQMVRIFQSVKSTWVSYSLAGLIAILFVLDWLTFTGMNFQQGNPRAVLLQWGLIAASLALGILAMTIIASEWGWPTSRKGLALGVSGVLGIYLLSTMVHGAFLSAGDPRSLWTIGSGSGQVNLLLDTIAEVSVTETGRWDSIQGAVINGNSTLRWALREHRQIKFYEGYDPELITPILITNEKDNLPVPLTIYRGQDFVITSETAWKGIFPDNWISWIAFRDGPVENENIILWVQHGILSGTNDPSGEN